MGDYKVSPCEFAINVFLLCDEKDTLKHSAIVADKVKQHYNAYRVAWLHDVIEDTTWTIEDIKNNVEISLDEETALIAITRKKSENYFDYIKRVSKNYLATKVKIADLCHNIERSLLDDCKHKLNDYYKALGMLRYAQLEEWE